MRTQRGQPGGEPAVAPQFARHAEHGRLLLDFAVAAQNRDAWVPRQSRKLVGRLGLDIGGEVLVLDRVVHVGEHEILPHQDAEFVAEVIEVVALVNHRAADAEHVHARIPSQAQVALDRHAVSLRRQDVADGPAYTSAIDRDAVDLHRKAVLLWHMKLTEAELATRNDVIFLFEMEVQGAREERLVAVGMRPPQGRVVQVQFCVKQPVGAIRFDFDRGFVRAYAQHDFLNDRRGLNAGSQRDHAIGAIHAAR